jgi:aminoacylase
MTSNYLAVNKLIEYIKIKTVHPEPDYESALIWLKEYCSEIGFDLIREVEVGPERKVLVATVWGTQPDEQSILLNSHMDVVPVAQEFWKCDAFEGKRYENGDIYGRGIQDMKSVGIQHLELIRKIKQNDIKLKRTIHVSFVPDEEIGGGTGAALFVKTQFFKYLNVGVTLDEGMTSPSDNYTVYYGERIPWWLQITCTGNTGHGSRFIEKTAGEKLRKILDKTLDYREEQKKILESNCSCMKLGDVTTLNLTRIEGGIANNIVPAVFIANFDIRITPKTDLVEFENQIQKWIKEAEDDDSGSISYRFLTKKEDQFFLSETDDDNVWWKSFTNSMKKMGLCATKEIFPAATDARFIRELGITAFGFTPLNNTPILLHDHNEFVNEKVFLRGIEVLYNVVVDLANI